VVCNRYETLVQDKATLLVVSSGGGTGHWSIMVAPEHAYKLLIT
jgi:hypothetical protein